MANTTGKHSLKDLFNRTVEAISDTVLALKVRIVDSAGDAVKIIRLRENLAGSAGTGSSGDPTRVYTLTTTNAVDIVEVFLDGVLLLETTQYTIANPAKTVTMVATAVFDSQTVTIFHNV